MEPLKTVLLTQFGIEKGLKNVDSVGVVAVETEMRQPHETEVLLPQSPSTLTHDEKKNALRCLMFIKKKTYGRNIRRGCAGNRKLRAYTEKNDFSSPTIAAESVLLIRVIYAKEKRDVRVMDVPDAFLRTPIGGERVHIGTGGKMTELPAMIKPKLCRRYIEVEHEKLELHVELLKKLYGMLQPAIQFWQQILVDLASLGFEMNPYDRCVVNRMID